MVLSNGVGWVGVLESRRRSKEGTQELPVWREESQEMEWGREGRHRQVAGSLGRATENAGCCFPGTSRVRVFVQTMKSGSGSQ